MHPIQNRRRSHTGVEYSIENCNIIKRHVVEKVSQDDQ